VATRAAGIDAAGAIADARRCQAGCAGARKMSENRPFRFISSTSEMALSRPMQPVPCLPFDVSFDLKATRLLRAHEMTRRAKGDVQHY
jgi:hypothetical protein